MTTYDLISETFYSGIPAGWLIPGAMIIGALLACIGEILRGSNGSPPYFLVAGHAMIAAGASAVIIFGADSAVRTIAILIVTFCGLRMIAAALSPGLSGGFKVVRTKAMISMAASVLAMLMCPTATYMQMEKVADFYDGAEDIIRASEQGQGPLNPAWISPNDEMEMIWVDRDPHKFERTAWKMSGLMIGESVWKAVNQGRLAENAYEPDEWNLIEVSIPAIDGQRVRILCEYDGGTLFRSGYILRNRHTILDSAGAKFAHYACPERFSPPNGQVISGQTHLALLNRR